MRRAGLALAALAAIACDGPATAPDASAPADAGGAPFVAPEPPAPPVLEPCPSGWSPRSSSGLVVCDPPPAEAPCPEGSARFAGSSECVTVGGACPAGDFPEVLPDADAHLFVRPGASGGDGTRERPFGRIGDAMRRARGGTAVVLAKGSYDEAIDVFAGVTVAGACARETVIAPSSGTRAAVRLGELDVALRDVTVRPVASVGGVEVSSRAELRGVIVEGAHGFGIAMASAAAELRAESIVVRGVTAEGTFGVGVAVDAGRVELAGASIEGCASEALAALGAGAEIVARDARLAANGSVLPGPLEVIAQDGGRVELRASVVERTAGGALAIGAGGTLVLEDTVLRGIRAGAAGVAGGVTAREGARVEARRVLVEDVDGHAFGIFEGSSALIEDVHVARIATGPAGAGAGLGAQGMLEARRIAIEDAAAIGVIANGPGAIELEDVLIARTGPEGTASAIALGLGGALVASATRVRIVESRGAAVLVTGAGTDVLLTELEVADTLSYPDGTRGRAIEVQTDARARIHRARVERGRETGILAIERGRAELAAVHVLDTLPRECAETTCADAPGGTALAAIGEGVLIAEEFEVDRARLCGAQVATGGALDLRRGRIAGATVGACVQVAGYDVSRLTNDVAFADNGVNVDATDHAVPEPGDPLPVF